MKNLHPLVLLATALIVPGLCLAGPTTIDFEGVSDFTAAPGLYTGSGVDFSSGAIVVSGSAGGSLNEVDFPPAGAGVGVFLNDADLTTLTFSNPIISFSGLFTYGGPLTLNFYDAGNVLLTTVTSAFSTNIGSGGDPGSSPNELLDPGALNGAVRVEIEAFATDFTLDDLTFEQSDITPNPVPEPGTFSCGAMAVAAGLLALRKRGGSN